MINFPVERFWVCRAPAAGEFRRLRAAGSFAACGRRGDDRHHFFSFPSKEKKRFRASKEEKGACCDIVPLYSQTELFAQYAGSAGASFLKLADACCGHFSNERGNKAPPCARRGPPGAGIRGKSVRHEDKQRADRRTAAIRFIKCPAKKGFQNRRFWRLFGDFFGGEKVTPPAGGTNLAARRRRNSSGLPVEQKAPHQSALRLTASPQGEAFGRGEAPYAINGLVLGLTMSRQSRSPRPSARISASAVAELVANGILFRSQSFAIYAMLWSYCGLLGS